MLSDTIVQTNGLELVQEITFVYPVKLPNISRQFLLIGVGLCVHTLFFNFITGLLDVARRTYTDIIDDIAGLFYVQPVHPLK